MKFTVRIFIMGKIFFECDYFVALFLLFLPRVLINRVDSLMKRVDGLLKRVYELCSDRLITWAYSLIDCIYDIPAYA